MRQIRKLYKRIPPVFGCSCGCTDCCGPVFMHPKEAKACEEVSGIKHHLSGEDCCYIEDNKCSVYEVRPLICRMFAAAGSELMTCPHGAKAKVSLAHKEERKIMDKYLLAIR